MRRGVYIALALLAGAIVANVLASDPGYVAIRIAGHLIEMSAITFVLLLVAGYFAIRLLWRLFNARRLWKESQLARRRERARSALSRAIIELAQGEWDNAERTATKFVGDSDHPLAHYLVAARAAELQNAPNRRDEWLARALDLPAESHAPALIMQAELLLKHKQLEAAEAALLQLDARGEQNARGLLLLARIYRQTGNWQKIEQLEPRLRATRGVDTAVADATVAQVYIDKLQAAGKTKDAAALRAAWKDLPRSLTKRSDIVVAYARAAMVCRDHESAERELSELLESEWDEAAVQAYGDLEVDEPLRTLDRAETWLAAHERDPVLLVACAKLALRAELYGKARSFLEASVAIRPRLEAYQLLADLLEQIGERDRALGVLHEALVHAIGRKPKVPRIRQRAWFERRHGERRR
jgi:HemY protein